MVTVPSRSTDTVGHGSLATSWNETGYDYETEKNIFSATHARKNSISIEA